MVGFTDDGIQLKVVNHGEWSGEIRLLVEMTDSGFCDSGDHLKNVYVIVLLERSQKKKKKIVSVRRDMKLKTLCTSFEISL